MDIPASPGGHMRREIYEQPRVLADLLRTAPPTLAAVKEQLATRDCRVAVLAARGSSDNASTYGKYLIESRMRLPAALAAPSLYTLYGAAPRLDHALVVGVSQSGGSVDVVAVVEEGRRQGAVTLGITNTADSLLQQAAEHTVLLNAGAEKALAATKTVTGQCLTYALLAGLNADAVPAEVESALAQDERLGDVIGPWLDAQRGAVIGRGFTYGAAQETALKLKETSFFSAEPYSGADFMHGPLALVEPGFRMLVLANHDETLPGTLALIDKARARGAQLTVFATREAAGPARADVSVDAGSLTAGIALIVLGQLFALRLALARGNDPDVSRGVSKVTVTR